MVARRGSNTRSWSVTTRGIECAMSGNIARMTHQNLVSVCINRRRNTLKQSRQAPVHRAARSSRPLRCTLRGPCGSAERQTRSAIDQKLHVEIAIGKIEQVEHAEVWLEFCGQNVVHLVAERITDRTEELEHLSEDDSEAPPFRSQAAAKHIHRHPRNVRVVPRSRDFH